MSIRNTQHPSTSSGQAETRFFEDFTIGETLISAERTLTAHDIETFATLSGDQNPLHLDENFATTSHYGRRIAHGLLVQAIASGLAVGNGMLDGTALGLRQITCKLSAAVYIGDTIHVQMQVAEKKLMSRLGGGNIVVNFRVINQDQLTVQKGTWQILVKLKPVNSEQ